MKELKIKTKNILVPIIILIIVGIICWSWVLISENDILSALKCSFAIVLLQGIVIRINDQEFASVDFLAKLSIALWVVSLSHGFTGVVPIIWIVITTIFYVVTMYKNLKVISEIRERRNRLYQ